MIDCNAAREVLALEPSSDDAALQEHLARCVICASYQRPHQSLDAVLRAEMRWDVPAELTARLLALAVNPEPAALPAVPTRVVDAIEAAPPVRQPIARARPKDWYVALVYTLTAVVMALSLTIAWQFFGALVGDVGFSGALTELLAAPARGLTQITQTLPESRILIAFFLRVRDQLLWLLLVAVLWAALDKWNPQISFRFRRPQLPS